MEVAASGYVKEFEDPEDSEFQSEDDRSESEDKNDNHHELNDNNDEDSRKTEKTPILETCFDLQKELQNFANVSENEPSSRSDVVVSHHEPLDEIDSQEVDELSESMNDWSGIRTKSHGAASLASMSTIHPDVIKQRVKKGITKRQNMQATQRIRAKGDASAVTRKKRENKELIRADGIWGWDN